LCPFQQKDVSLSPGSKNLTLVLTEYFNFNFFLFFHSFFLMVKSGQNFFQNIGFKYKYVFFFPFSSLQIFEKTSQLQSPDFYILGFRM